MAFFYSTKRSFFNDTKAFFRPHFDYTDIVYEKANNDFFKFEIKNV